MYEFNVDKDLPSRPLELLDLKRFKVEKCCYSYNHNHKCCIFFHNDRDRRREIMPASSELCQKIKKRLKCKLGDNCPKCHNNVEKMYREDNYKMKFCKFYGSDINKCEYKNFCCYAHSEEEIRMNLYHKFTFDYDFYIFFYKTQYCPFDTIPHSKDTCTYAHFSSEYRRKHREIYYDPLLCESAKESNYKQKFNSCVNGTLCRFSHNQNEVLYHPLCFKTQACKKLECQFIHCPNFHSIEELRELDPDLLSKIKTCSPRNRNADKKGSVDLLNESNLKLRKITDTTRDTSNLSQKSTVFTPKFTKSSQKLHFTSNRVQANDIIEMKRFSGQPHRFYFPLIQKCPRVSI